MESLEKGWDVKMSWWQDINMSCHDVKISRLCPWRSVKISRLSHWRSGKNISRWSPWESFNMESLELCPDLEQKSPPTDLSSTRSSLYFSISISLLPSSGKYNRSRGLREEWWMVYWCWWWGLWIRPSKYKKNLHQYDFWLENLIPKSA